MRTRLASLALVLAAMLILAAAAVAAPTTFVVDSASNTLGDSNLVDGVCQTSAASCTLRAAIEQVNAESSGGGPYTIQIGPSALTVASDLPAITQSGTFIDGCGVGRTDPGRSMRRTRRWAAPVSTSCGSARRATD